MRAAVFNFIKGDVLVDHPAVYWGLLVIWIVLITAAFLSLRQQAWGIAAKAIAFVFILGIPILGLSVYALICLFTADWSFLKPLLTKPRPLRTLAAGKAK